MTEPLIELRGVSRRYDSGPPALDDVSLTVAPGEALAILGPSGSGKSTLINLTAGLDKPTSGTVTIGGTRIDTLSEAASARYRRARIGLVFQFFNLLDDLTVFDNVVLPAQLAGATRRETYRRATELLRGLGIDRHARAYPGRLSGGQSSRASLAVALLGSPDVLVLDEPTAGLDPVLRRDLWALFHRLAETGVTVLVSSHVMDEADRCERLLLLREGLLLAEDTPAALRERTSSADIEGAFLALVEKAEVAT